VEDIVEVVDIEGCAGEVDGDNGIDEDGEGSVDDIEDVDNGD